MSVDWDSPNWGNTIHVAPSLPDAHDASEADAERGRG